MGDYPKITTRFCRPTFARLTGNEQGKCNGEPRKQHGNDRASRLGFVLFLLCLAVTPRHRWKAAPQHRQPPRPQHLNPRRGDEPPPSTVAQSSSADVKPNDRHKWGDFEGKNEVLCWFLLIGCLLRNKNRLKIKWLTAYFCTQSRNTTSVLYCVVLLCILLTIC